MEEDDLFELVIERGSKFFSHENWPPDNERTLDGSLMTAVQCRTRLIRTFFTPLASSHGAGIVETAPPCAIPLRPPSEAQAARWLCCRTSHAGTPRGGRYGSHERGSDLASMSIAVKFATKNNPYMQRRVSPLQHSQKSTNQT